MKAQEKQRSASCYRGLRTGVRRATCRAPEGDSLQRQRRQTLSEAIISFVGLDVHHDSIAGGSAPEGRNYLAGVAMRPALARLYALPRLTSY
jgi:hypothetical protein